MSLPDITCPNCHTVVNGRVKDSVVFGCSSCHNIFETDTNNALQPVAKLPQAIKRDDIIPKWLVLGAKIKRDGKVFTLSSIFRHGVNWTEQTGDGIESGYNEYLEWYFITADGAEFCLEQTDSKYKFQTREQTHVTKSLIGKAEGKDLHNWNPDYGTFSLLAFQGQDDEPLDRDLWNYKVARDGTSQISIEWKKNTPTADWRAYKLKQIRILELERWSIRTAEEIQEAKEEFENLGFYRSVFGISTLMMFLFILYAAMVGGKKMNCDSVWNFSAPTPAILNDTSLNINPAQYKRTFCSMKLEKNRPYCFSSRCSFAGDGSSASADFSINIVKLPEGQIVNTIGASFFSERGYDDEGSWSEATLSDYFYFRADETAEYEVTAVVEPKSLSNKSRSGVLQITVSPTVLSRYFIAMFLIFALIALVLQWQWEYRSIESGENKDTWLQKMFGK
jgi:hypothetical protein